LEKSEVRKVLRRQRVALSAEQVQNASNEVFKKFICLDIVRHAKRVAVYMSNENEIDTYPIIEWLSLQEKKIFLPVMVERSLIFCAYRHRGLIRSKFNILEPNPATSVVIEPEMLDILVVPLVAFDNNLCRLGRGGGYFDRALAHLDQHEKKPYLVGLAYHMQRIADCEPKSHDVKMDFIITP